MHPLICSCRALPSLLRLQSCCPGVSRALAPHVPCACPVPCNITVWWLTHTGLIFSFNDIAAHQRASLLHGLRCHEVCAAHEPPYHSLRGLPWHTKNAPCFKYVLTGGEIAEHYTHRYDRWLRGTINSWNLFQDQRENKSQSKSRDSRPYGPQPLKWSCCHRVPHQSLVRCQQMPTEYTGRNLRGHQHAGELSVFTEQKEDVTPDRALQRSATSNQWTL